MERLTKKGNEIFNYGEFNNKYTVDKQHISCALTDENYKKKDCCYIGNAIDKLAEFEDFIEEQGFKNLEDFKKALEIKLPDERVKQIAIEEMRKEMKNHIAQILKKEVPELYKYKDKWQELKFFVETEYKENSQMVDICKKYENKEKDMFLHYLECYGTLLDKIEELEKEIK